MISLSRFFQNSVSFGPNKLSLQILSLICDNFTSGYHYGGNINHMRIKNFFLVRNMLTRVITQNIDYRSYEKLCVQSQKEIKKLISDRLTTIIKGYNINHGHCKDNGIVSKDTMMYGIVCEKNVVKWDFSGAKHGTIHHKSHHVVFPDKLFLDPLELQRELQPVFDRVTPLMKDGSRRKFLTAVPNDANKEDESTPLLRQGVL